MIHTWLSVLAFHAGRIDIKVSFGTNLQIQKPTTQLAFVLM